MMRDNFAYWIGQDADLRKIPGCKELKVSHDFFVGACKVARWHSTKDERDAARRERERKETLAWAEATARKRLAAQGKTEWAERVRREADEMRAISAAENELRREREAAKREEDLTTPSGGALEIAESPKQTRDNLLQGASC